MGVDGGWGGECEEWGEGWVVGGGGLWHIAAGPLFLLQGFSAVRAGEFT